MARLNAPGRAAAFERGAATVDKTAWVAIAGISATLIAGILGPLLAERMRRESARLERLLGRRLDVYADLLRASARLADNSMTWSAIPLADLKETDDEELDRLVSQVRVVASKDVYQQLQALAGRAHEFNQLLFQAKLHHNRLRDAGKVDDDLSLRQRMSLGSIADEMRKEHKKLEATIRGELAS
jgi:hypothetical protein